MDGQGTSEPIVNPPLKYHDVRDGNSIFGTSTGVTCTNSEFIIIDLFVDDLPNTDGILQRIGEGKSPPYIQRNVVARFMLQRDAALRMANKIMMLHRRMTQGLGQDKGE